MDGRSANPTRPLYATAAYAAAFGYGSIDVVEWQTALLLRTIRLTKWSDALGCYPLTVFGPSPDLNGGLERLRAAGLVSVALVPDPLTSPSPEILAGAFEVCRPFKTHFLIDREVGPVQFTKNHRWSVRKGSQHCSFEEIDLRQHLELWQQLYQHTVARHGVTGIQDFTPSYFQELAEMPAVTALAARYQGRIVAIILWVRSGEIVYAHLEGGSPEALQTHATYGLIAAANEHFADSRIIHLGGAAGLEAERGDGLAHFKRGFANREVTAYFCGSRLHADRYAALTEDQPQTSFFPAYRQP
ncbi:MAG: GNAT family N-acetyltransferase [Chthoniobacterales bacterium]